MNRCQSSCFILGNGYHYLARVWSDAAIDARERRPGRLRKGSKVHLALDTLGHLLAPHVTPANEQDRAQVAGLAQAIQEVTVEHVEVAFVCLFLHRAAPLLTGGS